MRRGHAPDTSCTLCVCRCIDDRSKLTSSTLVQPPPGALEGTAGGPIMMMML
jgi:hypothetical protein